jgi:hypothetical protein
VADNARMQAAMQRLFRRGRQAGQESRPVPATVGELLALTPPDEDAGQARRDRRISEYEIDQAFRYGRGPKPRFRTGGPIVAMAEPRWAPPREGDLQDWSRAAMWAAGAVAWLKSKGVVLPPSAPIAMDGQLAVYGPKGNSLHWRCGLTRAVNEAFQRATGHEWFSVIAADPCDLERGLPELAGCEAYILTYDLESMEEANPPLVLLGQLAEAWRRRKNAEIDLSEQEDFFDALSAERLSAQAARQVLLRWAGGGDEWALPACWRSALAGVLAFCKFTDGPWAYWGDAAACSAGTVSGWRKKPAEYFSFIEGLVNDRIKLFDACGELISSVTKNSQAFWRQLARSIHADIENHPEWQIKFEEDKSLAAVLAREAEPKGDAVPAAAG